MDGERLRTEPAEVPEGTKLYAAQAVIEQMREVIAWYADEARACSKNACKESLAPEALLASVTVLALDGGGRADSVLATDNTALRDRLRQERERCANALDSKVCGSQGFAGPTCCILPHGHDGAHEYGAPRAKTQKECAAAIRNMGDE